MVWKAHAIFVEVASMNQQRDHSRHCGWSDAQQIAGRIGFGLTRLVDLGLNFFSPCRSSS